MLQVRPPTRGQWYFMRCVDSNAYYWGMVLLLVSGLLVRSLVLVGLALLPLLGHLAVRQIASYDEQEDSFSIPVDGATAERLAVAAMESLEPDQTAERDDDGALSIDLWRRGAMLGLHLVVRLSAKGSHTDVSVTSRYHVRQRPVFDLNATAVRDLRERLDQLATVPQ